MRRPAGTGDSGPRAIGDRRVAFAGFVARYGRRGHPRPRRSGRRSTARTDLFDAGVAANRHRALFERLGTGAAAIRQYATDRTARPTGPSGDSREHPPPVRHDCGKHRGYRIGQDTPAGHARCRVRGNPGPAGPRRAGRQGKTGSGHLRVGRHLSRATLRPGRRSAPARVRRAAGQPAPGGICTGLRNGFVVWLDVRARDAGEGFHAPSPAVPARSRPADRVIGGQSGHGNHL